MKFKSIVCSVALASSCLVLVGAVHAAEPAKGIKIADSTDTAAKPAKIELSVRAAKSRYAVNEKIVLVVKTSQDAYLYITTRSSNGDAVLLSPDTSGKLIQVKAGEQKIETNLVGDTNNETDEITIVAASSDLGIGAMNANNFESKLQAKGIRIAADDTQTKPPVGVAVSDPVKVKIRIGNPASADQDGLALVTTDKRRYEIGDSIRLAYGASKPGWVNVFVAYPDGTVQQVIKDKFDVAAVKTVDADVVAPEGRQTLVAVWSTDGNVDADALKVAGFGKGGDSNAAKGLKLRDAKPDNHLTVNFADVDVTK
jgi:hypothetical protein